METIMAKAGDWGSDPKMVPRAIKGKTNENFEGTTPRARPAQGPAPKLKMYSDPWYTRAPFDPEFRRIEAEGSDEVTHGQ